MKKKLLISLSVFAISVTTSIAQQTKLLSGDKHNEYGLVYTLPRTSFNVEVEVVKETKLAGPYYKYAKKYIGTDRVVDQNSEIWYIKNININPIGIPDEDNRYLMQVKPNSLTFIAVSDNGMLLAVNTEPEITDNKISFKPIDEENIPTIDEYLKYVNEDFASAISSAKKAELIAEDLNEIREAKLSLTRGTAETMPTDGKQLEIMLNSLERQEEALTAAFTGTVSRKSEIRNFSFTPEDEGRNILFRMSDFAGPVPPDDYSGEPVYIEVRITRNEELPTDSKGEEKKLPKDAVMYCVPGAAKISLSMKGETLFSGEFEIAQFGYVFGLNPSLFTDKKEPSFAIFDPATGALKELGTVRQ